jgi:circadian clock protein KaiB
MTTHGASVIEDLWYELTLVVSGDSELSTGTITNARRMCDTYLRARYHLSIVDLQEHPGGAFFDGQPVAAPALVKNWPLPPRKFVGDLSNTDVALLTLGLPADNDIPNSGEQEPSAQSAFDG